MLAVLSDSTNAENPIEIENEKDVMDYIMDTFEYHNGRIIVSAHSSNLARIQQVLNAAHQNDRKVAMIGHDVEKIVRTAIKLDKLHLPADDIFVDVKEINDLKDI